MTLEEMTRNKQLMDAVRLLDRVKWVYHHSDTKEDPELGEDVESYLRALREEVGI